MSVCVSSIETFIIVKTLQIYVSLFVILLVLTPVSTMAQTTALNGDFQGELIQMAISVELHERDGNTFASYGSAVPIHCCTPDEVKVRSMTSHHYCDIFSDQLLAPAGEAVYVRLNETVAEKVSVNRSRNILLLSSDGRLAQWRCSPTFESANRFVAGTPIVDIDGALVSVVTAKKGGHYALSNFEGVGGYFDSSLPWEVITPPENHLVYGSRTFETREQLRQYVASLEGEEGLRGGGTRAVAVGGRRPRVALVAHSGRQLAHVYLPPGGAGRVLYL